VPPSFKINYASSVSIVPAEPEPPPIATQPRVAVQIRTIASPTSVNVIVENPDFVTGVQTVLPPSTSWIMILICPTLVPSARVLAVVSVVVKSVRAVVTLTAAVELTVCAVTEFANAKNVGILLNRFAKLSFLLIGVPAASSTTITRSAEATPVLKSVKAVTFLSAIFVSPYGLIPSK